MDSDFTSTQQRCKSTWSTLWSYFFAIAILSCKTAAPVAYFHDIPDSTHTQPLSITSYSPPLIRVGDILSIHLYTLDTPLIQSANSSGLHFPVDQHGNIELPVIGAIEAEGLSTEQVHDLLIAQASKYYKNPVAVVRIANFTVSILGEVAKPGLYVSNSEKLSVLDALALAGDISIYGKKENVLIVRNTSAQKEAIRLNLNSTQSLASPYFYLRQGDVLMVEPNRHKLAAARDAGKARNYALIASGLSVVIIFLSRLSL